MSKRARVGGYQKAINFAEIAACGGSLKVDSRLKAMDRHAIATALARDDRETPKEAEMVFFKKAQILDLQVTLKI